MVWPDRYAEKQKIGWILLSFLFFLFVNWPELKFLIIYIFMSVLASTKEKEKEK